MRRALPILVGFLLACATSPLRAVDPIPESRQPGLALQILDVWHTSHSGSTNHRKLHVIYFTPADRDPEPRYRERLEPILEDIRAFYGNSMMRAGFGPETFNLARDAQGAWILHLVKGREYATNYHKNDSEKILGECRPALKAAGISPDKETILILCNLADWDEKSLSFRNEHSPYYGIRTAAMGTTGGLCFAVDTSIQSLDNLVKKEPILHDDQYGDMSLGRFNTIFIGGIAHELGHAFALPHCGERRDEKPLGTSLMGIGNRTYRDELRSEGPGSFLPMACAMRLVSRPLFSGCDQDIAVAPRLQKCEFQVSTNVSRPDLVGRPRTLRIEGVVKGMPPIYGVVAYFDSLRDGGYFAPTATSVPDADGRFAIEVSDLAPALNGELRIEYCHANGAISTRRASFDLPPDSGPALERWRTLKVMDPLIRAVLKENLRTARSELRKLQNSDAPDIAKSIAPKLVATLQKDSKPVPAMAPANIVLLPLGDSQYQSAEVGWLAPTANRIPPNNEISAPLLSSEELFATGLYAHAPSRYVYDLGSRWRTLRGEAGLHTLHQAQGAVVFVIKTDGREAFRSPIIRGADHAHYEVDLAGVNILELVVEKAGKQNGGNWSLWLDPMLSR